MRSSFFTAIPNWTGRAPVRGWPLVVLSIVWLAGRLAVAGVPPLPPTGVMALDCAFLIILLTMAGAEVVASDSGGFTVRNTNDLNGGIQRIAGETQAYYLLGYMPSNTARDGKFRKIQVKLANGRGLQVRARKGYYATASGQ